MTRKILLKVSNLKVSYGGIQAVKGVDFEVAEGELVSLIGSNGAGKTTTMKAITGTLAINAGDIEYLGKSIKGQGPWDLVKQGLDLKLLIGQAQRRKVKAQIESDFIDGVFLQKLEEALGSRSKAFLEG